MTFGKNNSSSATAFLGQVLQSAPPDARGQALTDGQARDFQKRFNTSANGPFEAAVVFLQALGVYDNMKQQVSAADVLDALFYVIAGSAVDRHADQYRKLLEAYWSNRAAMPNSLGGQPLDLITRKEPSTRSYGSLKLTLGAGCMIAEIDSTRFVASIAQTLRTNFRNCRNP
jgi:hypothetical protein